MMGTALNFVDIVACSVFLLLLLFILLHRLIWPVMERPVYACARYGVINKKTLLWFVGSGLILASNRCSTNSFHSPPAVGVNSNTVPQPNWSLQPPHTVVP
jgi:hypothetical protein